jgi:hypothetical protein
MNLGQAFSFPFQDTDWIKKIGLMALISLIPFIGQIIVMGWGLDVARRVIQRNPILLPDINLGNQLSDGFKAFLTSLVYALPIIVLQIPIIVVSSTLDSSSVENASAIAISVISLCCGGLMLLYALFLAFIVPAAFGNLAAKGSLSAAFDFKTVLGLVRAAPTAYLMVVLGALAASFIAGLGIIACFIGALITSVYSFAIIGNLEGQAYLEASSNLAGASPVQVF